jgi:hypothetical protein
MTLLVTGDVDTHVSVGDAIVRAVAYADIFDYPLRPPEVQRYLVGVRAPLSLVHAVLDEGCTGLMRDGDFVMLEGRAQLPIIRRRRAIVAARMRPRALVYARRIARLPFVRMVGLTGALAVANVEEDADIDYLIVTAPGRLWLCRALVIAMVRLAGERNGVLCPNYLISARALALPEHSLYSAHELTQMLPLAGAAVYGALRAANPWTSQFLPNATAAPDGMPSYEWHSLPTQLAEALLRTPAGTWVERAEMQRKTHTLVSRAGRAHEAQFAPDWCKGHFEGHGQRTLAAYHARLEALGIDAPL